MHRPRSQSPLHLCIRNIQIRSDKSFSSARRLLPSDMIERWRHVCCIKITFTLLLTNRFVSTTTSSMECIVNWISLRIRVRSRNTQRHFNLEVQIFWVTSPPWVVEYEWDCLTYRKSQDRVAHDLENISENFQLGKRVIFMATTLNLNTSKEKKGLLSVQTKGLYSEKGDRLHELPKSRKWISTHFVWIEAADYYTIWNPYSFCRHTCKNTQGSHVPFVHETFLRSGRRILFPQ